jgi:uncharacterized protein
MNTTPLQRNNLGETFSPYLKQHRSNPVWWQPWSREVLHYAREAGKPLFVSVGYATCHWCHVMAREAFSNPAVAERLNRDFVSIKIDREERPDIDHFLMQFLMATRGQGGWPLNAFLTPDLRPFFAMTYAPVENRAGVPGFAMILDRVMEFFAEKADHVSPFNLWVGASDDPPAPSGIARDALHRAHNLVRREDRENGGFGVTQKFPPHASMLYLLYAHAIYEDETVEATIRRTLDAMGRRGLHDHVQGGFFRYCVDQQWTIPHFEKMLYDQAMSLWVYSLASKVLDDEWYREIALGIVRALRESFTDQEGLFISAHDADTNHHEGHTYLWSDHDLEDLTDADRERLEVLFEIQEGGNFEGFHHLVRRGNGRLAEADRSLLDRLLKRRRERLQPETDTKIVTAWNALAASALVYAGRFLARQDLIDDALRLYRNLERRNRMPDGRWIRSSLAGNHNTVECLEDYGAVLYLVTLLAEHELDEEGFNCWEIEMNRIEERIRSFRTDQGWRYTIADDFEPVPADDFDSPTPSAVSLAEGALLRSALLRGDSSSVEYAARGMGPDLHRDFHNITVLVGAGEFYLLETADPRSWETLPPNTIQRVSSRDTWCYRGSCRPGFPERWNPPPETL